MEGGREGGVRWARRCWGYVIKSRGGEERKKDIIGGREGGRARKGKKEEEKHVLCLEEGGQGGGHGGGRGGESSGATGDFINDDKGHVLDQRRLELLVELAGGPERGREGGEGGKG